MHPAFKIRIWPISYIFLMLSATLIHLLTKLYLRVEVRGSKNIPLWQKKIIFCPTHTTHIDPWLAIGFFRPLPFFFFCPFKIPYFLAASDHFFKTPFLAFISSQLKCLEVKRKCLRFENDTIHPEIEKLFPLVRKKLKRSNVLIFPAGTRTPNGVIDKAQSGLGRIIYENPNCVIIPIKISFPQNFWPKEKKLPNLSFGLKGIIPKNKPLITITYGPAFQLSTRGLSNNQKTYSLLADQVKTKLNEL